MSLKTALVAATMTLASPLASPLIHAQEMDHSKMNHEISGAAEAPLGDQGPSSKAFAGANAAMHRGMAITYTGRADVDFARGMIAHHQGAIDMAKVELEFGTDPDLRALAQEVIKAQETEITRMKDWLAGNGG